jgi:caffeoyl-CoA O-methyltransferase
LLRPHRILEIGSFTGYSCLCLAEGLTDQGEIITIDKDPFSAAIAEKYFKESLYREKVFS